VFEYLVHQNSSETRYIQQIYNDGVNFRIICFTTEQARYFLKVRSFQMDMTFKRIAGDIYELAFATMDETLGQGTIRLISIDKYNTSLTDSNSDHSCPSVCK
jgi:hypothetical protein